jgi:hypothetical protein
MTAVAAEDCAPESAATFSVTIRRASVWFPWPRPARRIRRIAIMLCASQLSCAVRSDNEHQSVHACIGFNICKSLHPADHQRNGHRDRLFPGPGPALAGGDAKYQYSAPSNQSVSSLPPRFRLIANPIGGLGKELKLIDLFNRPIRPFNLDSPTLTLTKHRVENGFCRCHGSKLVRATDCACTAQLSCSNAHAKFGFRRPSWSAQRLNRFAHNKGINPYQHMVFQQSSPIPPGGV